MDMTYSLSTRFIWWLSGFPMKGTRFLIRLIYACDIGVRLPKSTHISHPLGIVINGATILGERITIQQHVTIGIKGWGQMGVDACGCPVIEDDVVICCNAAILGPITIGKGAVIGANAVVTKDVPAGAVIVGANRILRYVFSPSENPSCS